MSKKEGELFQCWRACRSTQKLQEADSRRAELAEDLGVAELPPCNASATPSTSNDDEEHNDLALEFGR